MPFWGADSRRSVPAAPYYAEGTRPLALRTGASPKRETAGMAGQARPRDERVARFGEGDIQPDRPDFEEPDGLFER